MSPKGTHWGHGEKPTTTGGCTEALVMKRMAAERRRRAGDWCEGGWRSSFQTNDLKRWKLNVDLILSWGWQNFHKMAVPWNWPACFGQLQDTSPDVCRWFPEHPNRAHGKLFSLGSSLWGRESLMCLLSEFPGCMDPPAPLPFPGTH